MTSFNEWRIDDQKNAKPMSPFWNFLFKAAVVVVAVNICISFGVSYTLSKAQQMIGDSASFWSNVEKVIYKVADADDLPEPRKAQIIAAIKEISRKYGPYFDAIGNPNSPTKQ